ncbi:class I SAM-dependent methyltransferase [Mycobacterium frederiksbergense]|uniref:class I SAM-dependent methyltransferase n=1 Tax=Mycolicibacterium frederiksbergense TaxID=117567 RepID=UPI0021F34220|nr:class I SAM-dependent methyltransferase [Mycolicibacterium frederiksbergense]MCV7046849.1 class I SAM-dependent methyltransferase [Mycolicibacterium frederiksbergense]
MRERFDTAYETHTAPWVIGEPQPTVVALERTGLLRSPVLDIGCGLGEHTILLTRLGYDVVGIDFAPHAIEQARANATARGVDARFEVGDAFDLDPATPYETVLDSALFHIFDDADRARYVESLRRVCRPGGYLHLLALSDAGRGFGPQVSEQVIRSAFAEGWDLEALETTIYRGVVGQAHAELLGLPAGTVVDEPAWLARVRRV